MTIITICSTFCDTTGTAGQGGRPYVAPDQATFDAGAEKVLHTAGALPFQPRLSQ